jgi:Fe-S-cluster-containing dehydrogenase component
MTEHDLSVDTYLCTACRACELACHYHHSATFGTSESSVLVRYRPDIGDVEISFDRTCDRCTQEVVPFCVQFCDTDAISLDG